MTPLWDWIDTLPAVRFLGLFFMLWGSVGLVLTLFEEWEEGRR